MNLLRYLLLAAVILGMNVLSAEHSHEHQERNGESHEHGEHHENSHDRDHHHHDRDNDNGNEDVDERDWVALREWLATKREEGPEQADDDGYDIEISGDLRTDWSYRNERANGEELLGKRDKDGFVAASRNDIDIEFNLRLDYKAECTWFSAQLQFDNAAGIKQLSGDNECPKDNCGAFFGSGDCDNICLRKAYMGYNISCNPCFKIDVELGRRGNLYNVFDSRVQFVSRFDGLLFKISSKMDCIDWYLNTAGFVIDERTNHFGWVTETGLYNIYKTSIDFKYSFIWWIKNGRNRCGQRDPKGFRFAISQFTLFYHLDPIWSWCKSSYFYGAFLVNHDSYHSNPTRTDCGCRGCNPNASPSESEVKRCEKKGYPSANYAFYVGYLMGKVVKQGDWSVELMYQFVQAKSIPDGDVSGIGRGTRNRSNFTKDLKGNTNYHGWRLEGLYAFTDNISLDVIVEQSWQLQTIFGGTRSYSKFEVEAIYAF